MSGVGEEEDRQTHTHIRCVEEVAFFLFLGFYRMNVTYPLKSPHITSDIGLYFRQYFFPHVFPISIHLERFRLQGLYLNVPYIVFLPQWPNIFTLTKTMFYKSQVYCKFFRQLNNTWEGLQ